MGKIKNWKKSSKYDGSNPQRYTLWFNTLPQYKDFKDNYYVTVKGQAKDYSVAITKDGNQRIYDNDLGGDGFSSYEEAVSFAVDYMRRNPQ